MLLSFTSNFFQNIIQSLFNVNKSQAKVGIKLNIGNGVCKNPSYLVSQVKLY